MSVQNSISRRLTLMNVLVSATALLLAGLAFFIYDHITFRSAIVRGLTSTAQLLSSNTTSALVFNDPEAVQGMLSTLANSPTVRGAAVTRPDGTIFASYASDGRAIEGQLGEFPKLEPGAEQAHRFTRGELLLSRAVVLEGKQIGTVHLRASLQLLNERLYQYLLIVAGVLLVSLGAALLVSSAYRKAVAGPIVQLADTARRVSEERDYSLRAPPVGTQDEVGVLISAFNEMLGQIQARSSELQQAHERLTVAQATAKLGEWEWEAATGTVLMSEATRQQHGLAKAEVPFAQWMGAIEPADVEQVTAALEAMWAGTGEREIQYRVAGSTGSPTWILVKAMHPSGSRRVIRGVSMDITNVKRAEEALLQSEKLATAGRLAASISHEINNPLESVTNLLYLVSSAEELPQSLREHVVLAEQELARVSHIAAQTLRFYRQNTKPASVDVTALLDSVLALLKGRLRDSDVQVERRYRMVDPLRCFDGEIRQVFTNLISNALDAMPEKDGRLLIRTSPSRAIAGVGRAVRIVIADTGSGMSPDVRKRIFEPFFSTKGNRGTGLGLWVTAEIIAKHGGSVRVRSTPGRGTVFAVTFPLEAIPSEQVHAISA